MPFNGTIAPFTQIAGAIIPISEQSLMETIEWEFIQLIVNANFDLKKHTHANFSIKNSELWLQLEWTIRYLPK